MKKVVVFFIIPVVFIFIIFLFNSREHKVKINDYVYGNSNTNKAVHYLKNKANNESITNYEDGNKGEMYTFSHGSTYLVPGNHTDYRYIGDGPNNYVYFNCSDINDTSTCEIWRVVGVFSVYYDGSGEKKERIKIVKDSYLTYGFIDVFNYDNYGNNSWENSSLNTFLNGDYYNSLSESSKKMIAPSKYFLGSLGDPNNQRGYSYYDYERKQYLYGDRHTNYPKYWTGNIGLMYPSDYAYIYSLGYCESCFNNPNEHSINNWFLSAEGLEGDFTFLLNRNGFTESDVYALSNSDFDVYSYDSSYSGRVRPVAYLNENVVVKSGEGTEDNPYLFQDREDYFNDNFDYKVGDKVKYNNEVYYVINNSLKEADYVTLLKDEPLKQIYTDYYNGDVAGKTTFYESKTCYYKLDILRDKDGCLADFDKSNVKKIVDNWMTNELDDNDLYEVDGYKVRLISVEDLVGNLNFEEQVNISGDVYYIATSTTPDFLYSNSGNGYWTISSRGDGSSVYIMNNGGNVSSLYSYLNNVYFDSYVKPVVNFKKEALGDKDTYSIGDEIIYKNEKYYCIANSSSNLNYVTVIKDDFLSAKQILEYGNLSKNIGQSYYSSCIDDSCENSYDNSNFKKIIDNWLSLNFDDEDLVLVDNYKGRLMKLDDISSNWFLVDRTNEWVSLDGDFPNWVNKYNYVLMDLYNGNSGLTISTQDNNKVRKSIVINSSLPQYYVRPVINLKKTAIGKVRENSVLEDTDVSNNDTVSKCTPKYKTEKKYNYSSYKIGDEITYNGDKYHVVDSSDKAKNYVTLLKDDFLKYRDLGNTDDVKKVLLDTLSDPDAVELTQFFTNDNCKDYMNDSECSNSFEGSNIKNIIDNWMKIETNSDDLISIDNYKTRLLNDNDLLNLGFDKQSASTYILYSSNPFYSWLYNENFGYWTMINFEDSDSVIYVDKNGSAYSNRVFSKYAVRPVINLLKNALGDKKNYDVGDKVTYMNNDYYVIENSGEFKNYVTLLKDKPLNRQQIIIYSDLSKIDNLYIYSKYFKSDECNNSENLTGCVNEFDKSNVKKLLDSWENNNDISKDLIEVDGYKTRLLKVDELLEKIGYDLYSATSDARCFKITDEVPSWIYDKDMKYWTMTGYEDVGSRMFIINSNGSACFRDLEDRNFTYVFNSYAIRPVINLNKCAIEGGCEVEEIEIPDGCLEDDGINVVDVPSTLSIISKIVLIISGILVLLGCSFIGYNYYIARKERK